MATEQGVRLSFLDFAIDETKLWLDSAASILATEQRAVLATVDRIEKYTLRLKYLTRLKELQDGDPEMADIISALESDPTWTNYS